MPGTRLRLLRPAAALLATLGVLGLTACGPIEEKVCGDSDYPIKADGGASGRACVPKGSPPPSGWTTYPPGQTPTTVP